MSDAVRISAIAGARRWYWQRISAMVLALCVVIHLVTIIYAVHAGLTAEAILVRTRGSFVVAGFYGLFVLACAVHVPIGIANVAREWCGLGGRASLMLSRVFALMLVVLGARAIAAVVLP